MPSQTSSNGWVNTLLWVRNNTPQDAVFAVDSRYFMDPDADVHGFRAVAERSALADYFKDGGVVSLFPGLAAEWKQMSNATYGLNHFQAADFQRLEVGVFGRLLDRDPRGGPGGNAVSLPAARIRGLPDSIVFPVS